MQLHLTGYSKSSLNLNVNLWWGLVLFVFGVVMLFFAVRTRFSKK